MPLARQKLLMGLSDLVSIVREIALLYLKPSPNSSEVPATIAGSDFMMWTALLEQ